MSEGIEAECTWSYLHSFNSHTDRCAAARDVCESSTPLNYHVMHYCWLGEHYYLTIPILALLILIKFNVLGHISDDYVSSAIAKLSKYLRFSESVAGATLLAFANGAPDIISVIMAALAGNDMENNDMAIGCLFGANIFTCTVVMALCVFAAKDRIIPNLRHSNVMFDLLFFNAGIIIYVILGTIEVKVIYVAIALLIIYVIYLIMLVRRDHHRKEPKKKEQQELGILEHHDTANAHKSFLEEESVLPGDEEKFQKVSFGEIYYKLKKRTVQTWTTLDIFTKLLYFIELPIQLMM